MLSQIGDEWQFFLRFYNKFYYLLKDKVIQEALRILHDFVREAINNAPSTSQIVPDVDKISICYHNFETIIKLLNASHQDRDIFLRNFPSWKRCRKITIAELKKIIERINTERKFSNVVNMTSSAVGFIAGSALLGSIIFRPVGIAVALPAAVTCGTAVIRGLGSASRLVATSTELALLKTHLDKVKEIIKNDKRHFREMENWFTYTDEIAQIMNEIIDFNVWKLIFKDLLDFCNVIRRTSEGLNTNAMRRYFDNLCRELIRNKFNQKFAAAVTGVWLIIFLIERQHRFLLNYILEVGTMCLSCTVIGLNAANIANPQNCAGVLKTVASYTVIGMALDGISFALSATDLANGSISGESQKLEETVEKLTEQLRVLKEVYQEIGELKEEEAEK